MELPQQSRSQMEFGNEEKLQVIQISNRVRKSNGRKASKEKFDGNSDHPFEVFGQVVNRAEMKALQQKQEQRINGKHDRCRDAKEECREA